MKTSRKLSFMIDTDIADELEKLIPPDLRNKFVTQAIANEMSMHRRGVVVSEMLEHCLVDATLLGNRRIP